MPSLRDVLTACLALAFVLTPPTTGQQPATSGQERRPAAQQPPPPGATLTVLSIEPAPHSRSASPVASIRVRFDRPVDPASLAPGALQVFGRWSGVADGTLSLGASDQRLVLVPARPFQPGEQVTVSLSSAIRGVGGEALVGGFASSHWIRPGAGSGVFALEEVLTTRLPGEGLVQSYGIYAGDLDGDGAPDFSIPNETANDVRVLRNDGCGGYDGPAVYALPFLSTPSANEGQDFDGDGDLDLAVANIDGDTISLLRGDGAGGYLAPETTAAGEVPRGLVVLDAEGDGDVDVVTANRLSSDLCLLRNDGTGAFAAAEVFEGGGAGETALAAADANGDGWTDLFVGLHDSAGLTLLTNDGAGGFTLAASATIGAGPWMLAAGDLSGEGHVDAVSVDAWSNTASVVWGDGAGGLTSGPALPTGFWPIAVDLGDLEGDGDLDVVTAAIAGAFWRVAFNDGFGGFGATLDLPAGTAASCATLVDDDRDGLLDIVGIDEVADEISLWRQVQLAVPGVQGASCEASLRLDTLALSAGFGGRAPHPLQPGEILHLGLSGPPGASFGLLMGPPRATGVLTTAGLLNVAEPLEVTLVGTLNAQGELSIPLPLDPDLPPGLGTCLQLMVGQPGAWNLSNPEQVQVAP